MTTTNRIRANGAALATLKELDSEGRTATADEARTLAGFTGWGGLGDLFTDAADGDPKGGLERLTDTEYQAAHDGLLSSYYTPEAVTGAVGKALDRLGLDRAAVLEPFCGTGALVASLPERVQATGEIVGVEADPIPARIAGHRFPDARIIPGRLEDAGIPTASFDLAVSNPPYGEIKAVDFTDRDASHRTLHNYGVVRALNAVKPGGIAVLVVSRYFLDGADATTRADVARKAALVDAVRLPAGTFTGTEVVADVLVFQRREAPMADTPDVPWLTVPQPADADAADTPAPFNPFFDAHPERVLGTAKVVSGPFGPTWTVAAPEAAIAPTLTAYLETAVQQLPFDRPVPGRPEAADATVAPSAVADPDERVGGYSVDDVDRIVVREPDTLGEPRWTLVSDLKATPANRIRAMLPVRRAVRALHDAELRGAGDGELAPLRDALNTAYDGFTKRFGYMRQTANLRAFGSDPDYPLLAALESEFDSGVSKRQAEKLGVAPRKPSAEKAAIFHRRVIHPDTEPDTAATADDALLLSLNHRGGVDPAYMADLLDRDADAVLKELADAGRIYHDPATDAWEQVEAYLAGDVVGKLGIAQAAAEADPAYAANVEALEAVQPPLVPAEDIHAALGSPWIPEADMAQFVEDLIGVQPSEMRYLPVLGTWAVKIRASEDTANTETWGTPAMPAAEIVTRMMTGTQVKVWKTVRDGDGNETKVVDPTATAEAQDKAEAVAAEFKRWLWSDPERRDRLTALYNHRFNRFRDRTYDGAHLTFPGMSPDYQPWDHQRRAAARIIQDGVTLLDHVVGSGKTLSIISGLMERRRLGLTNKPMVVVPNSLLSQWAAEWKQYYPKAKLLVATPTDFTPANRRRLFARMATEDWDGVIVAHSSFTKIGLPTEVQQQVLAEEIERIVWAERELDKTEGDTGKSERELAKRRKTLQNRHDALMDRNNPDDNGVDFLETGVDFVALDEYHRHAKNKPYVTRLHEVRGLGDTEGSGKAEDFYVKTRALHRMNGGVVLATGTPVSNTVAEMHHIKAYLAPAMMDRMDLDYFDAWAKTFAEISDDYEINATGGGLKLTTRMRKFGNLPELMSLYRQYADVYTATDRDEAARAAGGSTGIPAVEGGGPENVIAPRNADVGAFMDDLIDRYDSLKEKDPSEDNALLITHHSRLASLGIRYVPTDLQAKLGIVPMDDPRSKVNEAVRRIIAKYKEWHSERGTQLVFSDLGTPIEQVPDWAKHVHENQHRAALLGDESAKDALAEMDPDTIIAASTYLDVYNEIRDKLMMAGIPGKEVRFVHEAKTDQQRADLFEQVRQGTVRVLLGSTPKLGEGANVQNRLVAMHHIDCPWRSADLEQRQGRGLRPGNRLFQRYGDAFALAIYRYGTEKTFDSRSWQIVEYKARFIAQLRSGATTSRETDDIGVEAAEYGEIKAALTGNPLVWEQVRLHREIQQLDMLAHQHQRRQFRLQRRINDLADWETRLSRDLTRIDRDMAHRQPRGEFAAEVDGTAHTDQQEAGSALTGAVRAFFRTAPQRGERAEIARYRGFVIAVEALGRWRPGFNMVVHNPDADGMEYTTHYKRLEDFSGGGFFTRTDNRLAALENYKADRRAEGDRQRRDYEGACAEVDQPFPRADELAAKRDRFKAVVAVLEEGHAPEDVGIDPAEVTFAADEAEAPEGPAPGLPRVDEPKAEGEPKAEADEAEAATEDAPAPTDTALPDPEPANEDAPAVPEPLAATGGNGMAEAEQMALF